MSKLEFDYVIVGAGSAGCVLAARLTQDPNAAVRLLEAGGPDNSVLIHAPAGVVAMVPTRIKNYAYETVPQPGLNGRRGYQPRGKTLGGRPPSTPCSTFEGMHGITTIGRRSAIPDGLTPTCCRCSNARRTTSSSETSSTARAGRSTSPIPVTKARCHSFFSPPPLPTASRSTPTTTARNRKALSCTRSRTRTANAAARPRRFSHPT